MHPCVCSLRKLAGAESTLPGCCLFGKKNRVRFSQCTCAPTCAGPAPTMAPPCAPGALMSHLRRQRRAAQACAPPLPPWALDELLRSCLGCIIWLRSTRVSGVQLLWGPEWLLAVHAPCRPDCTKHSYGCTTVLALLLVPTEGGRPSTRSPPTPRMTSFTTFEAEGHHRARTCCSQAGRQEPLIVGPHDLFCSSSF